MYLLMLPSVSHFLLVETLDTLVEAIRSVL